MEIKCIETGVNETTEWGVFRVPDPQFPYMIDRIKFEGFFQVGDDYELIIKKIEKEA